jgi:hypothetical protein
MGYVSCIDSLCPHTHPYFSNIRRQPTAMRTCFTVTITIDLTDSDDEVDDTTVNTVINLTESDDESVGSVIDLTQSDDEMEVASNHANDLIDSDDGSITSVHTHYDLTESDDEMNDIYKGFLEKETGLGLGRREPHAVLFH